ncbi:MAG: DUF2023 family protein [Bacteroidales bacterium]|nr:DUF2023 family protein [Bacteroidales bacterium]
MKVFCHHIYEYKKGLRNLILHTMAAKDVAQAIKKLNANNIDYLIQQVTSQKVNVFFGAKECVEVIACFCHKPLNELTTEEDFILGTLLGYNQVVQCARFLKRKETILIHEAS